MSVKGIRSKNYHYRFLSVLESLFEDTADVLLKSSATHNREVLVHLTEKAQQELQQCTAKQQTVTEIIPSTFTKDDCRQLKELLTKIIPLSL
jgi:ElaB/YqjD/DUF883 family membrane-anchored ribosome-binding protein